MNQNALHLLNPAIEVVCFFAGSPLVGGSNIFEVSMLQAIDKTKSGFKLYRTEGLFKNRDWHTQSREPIYKLSCPASLTDLTFTLSKWRGQQAAIVLMLNTAPSKQGNYYRLKRFILNVCKVLFSVGLPAIVGDASPNGYPVRHKRDFRRERATDGTPKLVKLYQHLGFKRTAGNNVAIRQEDFICA